MPGRVGTGRWRADVMVSVHPPVSSPRPTLRGLRPALPDVFPDVLFSAWARSAPDADAQRLILAIAASPAGHS